MKYGNCNVKWQFMVANNEIVELIAVMQHLIEIKIFLYKYLYRRF